MGTLSTFRTWLHLRGRADRERRKADRVARRQKTAELSARIDRERGQAESRQF